MGVCVHGHGPGPGRGVSTACRTESPNAFGVLEDTATKKCSNGMTLAMVREKYEYGARTTMNDKSLRGPEGRLKLVVNANTQSNRVW